VKTKKDQLGFWGGLSRPFFVLAPMADVTDPPFRRIIAKYGKPDVMYTQFVSADGLCSPGRRVLLRDLSYGEGEHPIVAQLFGARPEKMREAARLVSELGFDGIDINMGCPDRNVEKQGAGAALIKNPNLAKELIYAVRVGAPGLPISIKTRIGYRANDLALWLPALLETKPAAIIIHARTRQEMSKVPAHWETITEAVTLARGSGTFIIGNGDVTDIADARAKVAATGCDGIMFGRAIFGNPWFFNEIERPSLEVRLRVMLEHTAAFEEMLGDVKPFPMMKKHFKSYLGSFPGARDLRLELMECNNTQEVKQSVEDFLSKIR
jgi:nifR3 family TIM-barrel protein